MRKTLTCHSYTTTPPPQSNASRWWNRCFSSIVYQKTGVKDEDLKTPGSQIMTKTKKNKKKKTTSLQCHPTKVESMKKKKKKKRDTPKTWKELWPTRTSTSNYKRDKRKQTSTPRIGLDLPSKVRMQRDKPSGIRLDWLKTANISFRCCHANSRQHPGYRARLRQGSTI